jgi:DNA polymerase-1
VKVDTAALGELSKTLETDMKMREDKIFELAGTPFNIGSPKQAGRSAF